MSTLQSTQRREYAFYASSEHCDTLMQLDKMLGLNVQFEARNELASSLQSALSVPLNLRREYQEKRERLKAAIDSVLDPVEGKELKDKNTDCGNPVSGKMKDFQLAASLLQVSTAMPEGQISFIRALLLNAIMFETETSFVRPAITIRTFLSNLHRSDELVQFVPDQISNRRVLNQVMNSLLNLSMSYKGCKTHDFIKVMNKLLLLVRPMQKNEKIVSTLDVTEPGGDSSTIVKDDSSGGSPCDDDVKPIDDVNENLLSEDSLYPSQDKKGTSRHWIEGIQNLTDGDYRHFTAQELPLFAQPLKNEIISEDPTDRNTAAALMLIFVTGEERDCVLDFTFGEDCDITPSGQYRRDVRLPDRAFVQKDETAEQVPRVEHFYLDLPAPLKKWLSELDTVKTKTILECLGTTRDDAEANIVKLLEKIRKTSQCQRIRLDKIKSALKLELTLKYRDESLTHLIAGKITHDHPTISYYIAHTVESIKRSYSETVNELLCNQALVDTGEHVDAAPSNYVDEFTTGYYPTEASIKSLPNEAANALKIAMQSKNIFDIHNAYTDYCLLLLFHATGHRPVEDPFPQYSHFNLANNFLLISDKVTSEGQKWRMAALPEAAAQQIRHYYKYLQSLPSKFFVMPEYAHIGNTLANWQNGHEKSLPFFFYLSETPTVEIESITRGLLEQRWSALWQWPPHYPRHILATELLRQCGSGELVKIQLGHNYGNEHWFGIRSHFPLQATMKKISEYTNNYLQKFGWKVIKSPIRKTSSNLSCNRACKAPIRKMGYEKRNKKRREKEETAKELIRRLCENEFGDTRLNTLSTANIEVLLQKLEAQDDISDSLESRCFRMLERYLRFFNKGRSASGTKYAKYNKKEVSPFSESDVRNYAASNKSRSTFIAYLNTQGKSKKVDINRRYAEIAVSASICGGLLRPELLEVLEQVISKCLFTDSDDLFIDYSHYEQTAKSRFRWYPDNITRSLIIGLIRKTNGKLKAPHKKVFNKQVCELLQELNIDNHSPFEELARIGKELSLIELPMVFREYAKGAIPTACLPLKTLVRINSNKALVSQSDNFVQQSGSDTYWLPTVDKSEPVSELREFRKLFRHLKKVITGLPTHGKYINRKKMCKEELCNRMTKSLHEENKWNKHSKLIAGFTIYLCKQGTKNKKNLAFSTIVDYTGYILILFEIQLKGESIYDLSDEAWEDIYLRALASKTKKQRKKACYVFNQFHSFLVEKYGFEEIDWSPMYATIGLIDVVDCIDAEYISEAEYLDLIDVLLTSDWIDGKIRDQLALMVFFGYRGGLRNSEAHGLLSRDVLANKTIDVIVKANKVRSLKSSAAIRAVIIDSTLSEVEVRLIERWSKTKETNIKEDPLYPVMQLRIGKSREVIDRGLATRTIHQCLRALTGCDSLRFHHLRHSRVYDLVSELFQNSDFLKASNLNLYPLHKIATKIGHVDILTTISSYTHNLDKLLSKHLPNVEHLLTDYGKAYCLGVAYNSIRKWRFEDKGDFSSLQNHQSVANLIQKPDITVVPRDPSKIKKLKPCTRTTLTLLKIEDLLRCYALSPCDLAQFTLLTGVPEEILNNLFCVTRQIEREAGYPQYFAYIDENCTPTSNSSYQDTPAKFSAAENKKLRQAILIFEDEFLNVKQNLAVLKNSFDLWSSSYHHANASNLLFTQSECLSLNTLIQQLFGKVNIEIRFESVAQSKGFLPSVPNNIVVEYKAIPKTKEKIHMFKRANAEFRIQKSGERRLINRLFFILCIYFRFNSDLENQCITNSKNKSLGSHIY